MKRSSMAIATMTSKGQLTVPKEIRDRLGLRPGDKVELVPSGERRRDHAQAADARPARSCWARCRPTASAATLEEMEEDIGDAIVEVRAAPVIGLDTNVLLRALLHDQGAGGRRARELLERACARPASRRSSTTSCCARRSGCWRAPIATRGRRSCEALVERSSPRPSFLVADREPVEEALQIFRASRADFADALIGVLNRRAGCATTYTFDRRAAETAEFSLVD